MPLFPSSIDSLFGMKVVESLKISPGCWAIIDNEIHIAVGDIENFKKALEEASGEKYFSE